jgi:hypothetical protein
MIMIKDQIAPGVTAEDGLLMVVTCHRGTMQMAEPLSVQAWLDKNSKQFNAKSRYSYSHRDNPYRRQYNETEEQFQKRIQKLYSSYLSQHYRTLGRAVRNFMKGVKREERRRQKEQRILDRAIQQGDQDHAIADRAKGITRTGYDSTPGRAGGVGLTAERVAQGEGITAGGI